MQLICKYTHPLMNRTCVLELIKANVGCENKSRYTHIALSQSQDSGHLIFYLLWILTICELRSYLETTPSPTFLSTQI